MKKSDKLGLIALTALAAVTLAVDFNEPVPLERLILRTEALDARQSFFESQLHCGRDA
jgi:hypothetical protein